MQNAKDEESKQKKINPSRKSLTEVEKKLNLELPVEKGN